MTDGNREEAQAELRKVIADSFVNKTLWTTDWDGVQLQRYSLRDMFVNAEYPCTSSLLPKPVPNLNSTNPLKRKQ